VLVIFTIGEMNNFVGFPREYFSNEKFIPYRIFHVALHIVLQKAKSNIVAFIYIRINFFMFSSQSFNTA
jgi:hypothetical protein